jgi:hypothetical protein
MKSLAQVLIAFICIVIPVTLYAQKDDSKYLAGAVPEVDGKVVFSKEFSIPGMSEGEIYNRMQSWMEKRLAQNNNKESRIVYTKQEDGTIVGVGKEWIVFSSSALSLDRTEISYQISASCKPEKCTLEIEKIRFSYREGKEKYTAEEWITDKYALNKTKTKLVRGLAKWRRNTVNFVDNLCLSAAEALSMNEAKEVAAAKETVEKKEQKSIATSGTMVITPQKEVSVSSPIAVASGENKIQVRDVAPKGELKNLPTVAAATDGLPGYKQLNPKELSAEAINVSSGKLVIVIGEGFNISMMTANAGGSLGKVSGKQVIYTFLAPDQPYEQMEKATSYTVRFYPNNQTEPSVILECKKMPSQAPLEGQPRIYAGEIVKAWTK